MRQEHLDKGSSHISHSIQVCSITANMNMGKEHNGQVKLKENFMLVERHDVKLWKMPKPVKSGWVLMWALRKSIYIQIFTGHEVSVATEVTQGQSYEWCAACAIKM